MNVENKYFPPLADPDIWQLFVDSTVDTNSPRQYRDGWHFDELLGDKYMATIALILFKKYDISHPWSNVLLSTVLANEYQKNMSWALGLPTHLRSGLFGKKGSADTLEVIIIPISSLIDWRILRLLNMILCIYSPHCPWRIVSSASWKKHGGRFWFTSKSFIIAPFAWTGCDQ